LFVSLAAAAILGAMGLTGTATAAGTGDGIVRAGVKPIHATARPASNTLTIHSSATKGVVEPATKVYLVFWGSQWSSDPAGAAPALKAFFTGLFGAPDTYDTILAQYCEGVPVGTSNCGSRGTHIRVPAVSELGGVWYDKAAAAPNRATAARIAREAVDAARHFHNTTATPNLNAQYVIASASGTHPDGFPNTGFCAYHSNITSTYGKIAYTNLPYVPDLGNGACTTLSPSNLLDGYFSTETHEYSETVTDPAPSAGWYGGGNEIGDECVQLDAYITLPTGTFDVQGEWSNASNGCVTHR
jgi:hypothetical protein